MIIERIQQRGPNDCGIAAIAMACGVPYEDVLPLLNKGSGGGINETDMYDWMLANGWAWQLVYRNQRLEHGKYQQREPWPPQPFAPAHIVMVRATQDWHFTVMDGAGRVFDPWTDDRKSLDHPDYRDISWVMGVWKIRKEGFPLLFSADWLRRKIETDPDLDCDTSSVSRPELGSGK